jgi:autotransporter-associated beta strand protein
MITVNRSAWLVAGLSVLLTTATLSLGADFTWLNTPASGTWNGADANWSGAGSVWTNGSANNAVFGASSTQNVTADAVTMKGLTFNADGYVINGGPLLMYGSPTVGAGLSASLTAPVTNVGVWVKSGTGKLTLSPGAAGTNTFYALKAATGTLQVVSGTTLVTQSGSDPQTAPAFWVSGGTLVVGGGLLKTTGNMYARVSEYGTLLITNGLVDLTANNELLSSFNTPGTTTVSGSGILDVQSLRVSQNSYPAAQSVININTGGIIRLNWFGLDTAAVRNGTVSFNGGTLFCKADGANLLSDGHTNWSGVVAYVREGGAIIDSNAKNVTIRQALLSGAAVDGGLTKKNSGFLYLRGTNTYNGGTTVMGGGLGILNDRSLGAVPATPATNLTFASGSCTLQALTNQTLSANRIIRIPTNVTVAFDTQGYTQTVYGVVGSEDPSAVLLKNGAGMLVLDPGAASVNTFGTLQPTAGTLVIASGTNLVTCPNAGQNAPGLRISGGTLLLAGGVLKTTARMFVNVDGGHLMITNGLADFTSCDELLNGIGSTYGYTTVSGSGVLLVNMLRISQNSGNPSNTAVSINTGGIVRLTKFYIDIGFPNQKGMLLLNGGTVEPRGDNADFLGTTEKLVGDNNDKWLTNITVNVLAGGAIFNTAGKSISIKQPLLRGAAVDSGLIKRGAGTLTLLNTNTYSGATSVEAGALKLGFATNTLLAGGSAWISSNAVLDINNKVQSLASLGGSGTVTNNSLLTVAGAVVPGGTNSVGTLTLASACPLSGVLTVDVSTNGVCDCLYVQGNLDIAGLALTVANTNSLNKDKRYTVASCSGTLTNAFLSAPLPLRWRVNYDTAGKSVYLSYNRGTLLWVQ